MVTHINQEAETPADREARLSVDRVTGRVAGGVVTIDDHVNSGPELEYVLRAWHEATVRLQKSQETLRSELRRLSTELNRKNEELERKNHLADLGHMAVHVTHEVRNSMMPLKLYLGLLERRVPQDDDGQDLFGKFYSGFSALETIVNDLLHFTADRNPVWQEFDLRGVVNDIGESLSDQLQALGIEFQVDIPLHQTMNADVDMLRRALLNLAINSIEAMPHGGTLYLTSFVGPDYVEIEVADSGEGLGEEEIRRACEPFFTTKSAGTGLGLSIVERMASVHGGKLTVKNCPEGGAAFTLVIPRQRQMGAAA
ncbi:MAG: HAMP domain-containing sensor histidine kinase [Pirellulaceae bacterium]